VPGTALPRDILRRPAAEGARLVALSYLDQAAAALPRLDDPADSEALHDFRVALRRLRSTLRAYRPLIGDSVRRRTRRRLRDLGHRTNAGRDAEVHLEWLRNQVELLAPRERPGLQWLIERLDERRASEYAETVRDLRRVFPRIERRLRRGLGEYRTRVPPSGEPGHSRFGAAAGTALRTTAAAFHDALAAIEGVDDAAGLHAARIAGKRVRYAIEPVATSVPAGASLVRRLKSLQDLLGEANDCHVLDREVREAVAAAGATGALQRHEIALARGDAGTGRARRGRRDPGGGLLAVARLLRERRLALFARLEEEWLADGGRGFAEELETAAAVLVRGRRAPARPRHGPPLPTPPPIAGA